MCAILDANSAHDVFGRSGRSTAGKDFYAHLQQGGMELVVGGKVLQELRRASEDLLKWIKEADRGGHQGRIRRIRDEEIETMQKKLERAENLRSDDPHVIALAQASGARLLYTKDEDLRQDFKDKEILNKPRGKLYPLGESQQAKHGRQRLRKAKDLCR